MHGGFKSEHHNNKLDQRQDVDGDFDQTSSLR